MAKTHSAQIMDIAPMFNVIEFSITRPANATAYAAGDIWTSSTAAGVNQTLTNIAQAEGLGGKIVGAVVSSSATWSSDPNLELWLFDTAPALGVDNAAFDPTDAEMLNVVGVINFASGDWKVGLAANNAFCHGTPAPTTGLVFKCTGAERNLYAALVIRTIVTPASAQVLNFRIMVEQS